MNNYEENGGCLNALIKYGVLFLVILGVGLIRFWFTKDDSFWIDKNVTDTGIYLTAEDSTYVTPLGKENVGKHFRIVCKVPKQQRVRGNRLYFPAQDIVSGRTFALLADEELEGRQIAVDGLLCGYVEGEKIGNRTTFYPVMRVCSYEANNQTAYELTAPVQRVETPEISASGQGVTLTLERVEYRGVLCRVCFTVENHSGEQLYLREMNFRSGGKDLGGSLVVNRYVPPYQISKYLQGADEVYPNLVFSDGDSTHAELSILPFAPEDTLEISLVYNILDPEKTMSDEEFERIDVNLSYCAEEAPNADEQGDAA